MSVRYDRYIRSSGKGCLLVNPKIFRSYDDPSTLYYIDCYGKLRQIEVDSHTKNAEVFFIGNKTIIVSILNMSSGIKIYLLDNNGILQQTIWIKPEHIIAPSVQVTYGFNQNTLLRISKNTFSILCGNNSYMKHIRLSEKNGGIVYSIIKSLKLSHKPLYFIEDIVNCNEGYYLLYKKQMVYGSEYNEYYIRLIDEDGTLIEEKYFCIGRDEHIKEMMYTDMLYLNATTSVYTYRNGSLSYLYCLGLGFCDIIALPHGILRYNKKKIKQIIGGNRRKMSFDNVECMSYSSRLEKYIMALDDDRVVAYNSCCKCGFPVIYDANHLERCRMLVWLAYKKGGADVTSPQLSILPELPIRLIISNLIQIFQLKCMRFTCKGF